MNYLVEYQRALGLDPDGKIGPNTAKAMMADLGITDKLLFSHVMGQVAHESGLYTNFRENLSYSSEGLQNIFRKYYTPQLADKHARHPELIANHVYASRMGNGDESSGDGWKYRGIFGLQLTGKTNIQEFLAHIGLPIDTDPDSLKDNPKAYFQAAFFWFEKNGANKLCTSTSNDCILNVSRKVNIGNTKTTAIPHGFDYRKAKTQSMFKALGLA